jgi:23S rRNA (cytosine1962-C5)-methyltransferase
MQELEALTKSGYIAIQGIIPVEEDVTGYPGTVVGRPPADPAPFNHPTKIVVLKVNRKTTD